MSSLANSVVAVGNKFLVCCEGTDGDTQVFVFSLEQSAEMKRQIGRTAQSGVITWEWAMRMCRAIVRLELRAAELKAMFGGIL